MPLQHAGKHTGGRAGAREEGGGERARVCVRGGREGRVHVLLCCTCSSRAPPPAPLLRPPTTCEQQVDAESSAVSFFDLSGLWVILAAGLALGIIVMVAQRTLRRRSKQRGKRAVPFPNTAHNDNFERAVEGYKGGAAEAEGTEEEGSSDLEAAPPQQQQQRQRPQEQQQQRNGARGGEHPPAAAAAAAPVATSELYRVPTVFTHTTTTTTARRQ